jgi:hypothetical protein
MLRMTYYLTAGRDEKRFSYVFSAGEPVIAFTRR